MNFEFYTKIQLDIYFTARSPLIGHLNSSLEGITTVRAFKAQEVLKAEFDKHQDLYTSANYTSLISRSAFSFFMDFFSVSFTIYIIMKFLFTDAAGKVLINLLLKKISFFEFFSNQLWRCWINYYPNWRFNSDLSTWSYALV